ncbi:MAG: hypothetical protein H3C47_03775 [Candidatus Cloacimonetes bacterium]|nr:hypothetical protein [Candidatus Cloacimonadota bacterium]
MKSLIPILIVCLFPISLGARQRGFENQRFYTANEIPGVMTQRPLMPGSDSSIRILSDVSSKPQNPIREKLSLFPEIERLPGFETSFGPGIVWTRPMFENQVLHVKASQVTNNLKSPHSSQSLTINKLELEWKYYLNKKLFFSSSLGFRDFKANVSMQNYYKNRGEILKEQDHIFGSLSLGMKIMDKMPLTKTALTARIGWHFSEEFVFPSRTPTGTKSLDFDGVRFGMGMGF